MFVNLFWQLTFFIRILYMNIQFTHNFKEPTDNYNLISTAIFLVEKSYKSTLKYYNGLKLLSENFDKVAKGYYLRIYYDDSVIKLIHSDEINKEVKEKWIPLFKDLERKKNIQLVHYDYPQFKKGNYHDGLIGTIVRFYPMFDFPVNKNIDMVIVSDVDVNYGELNMIDSNLSYMNKVKTKFHFYTVSCYPSISRFSVFPPEFVDRNPYGVCAGRIVSKIKFPSHILTDFFDCMSNLDSPTCSMIKDFIKGERNSIYAEVQLNYDTNFVYGIDEYILYKYICEYVTENKIPTSINMRLDTTRVWWMWYLSNIDKPFAEDVVRELLKENYDSNKTPKDNFLHFDKVTYHKKNTLQTTFNNNALNFIRKISSNKNYEKYGFRKKDITCIMEVVNELQDSNRKSDNIFKVIIR